MVVCLSTNAAYIEETINSIKYANKARKITKQSNISSQSKLSTKEEFYKKRVFELEQECRHLKTVLRAKENSKSRENIKTMISYASIDQNPKNENLKEKFQEEEKQFSELLESLLENVEDANITKQNIIELDELISGLDSSINFHQQNLENREIQGKKEEKILEILQQKATQLEDNLDLKEEAINEVRELEETIVNTKDALKGMYLKRLGDREKEGGQSTENFLEDKFILQRITSKKDTSSNRQNEGIAIVQAGKQSVLDVIQGLTEQLRPTTTSQILNKENLKNQNFGELAETEVGLKKSGKMMSKNKGNQNGMLR